jgi:hypothetical protein
MAFPASRPLLRKAQPENLRNEPVILQKTTANQNRLTQTAQVDVVMALLC